uniref:Fe2OG dioxygenase domain-containing protein n=1 Tax=viral metagenome TaxID=1070528 RepID=A0A6C0JEC2_9ZZZZ
MNRVFYQDKIIPSHLLEHVKSDIANIPWCRAPAGIPGNYAPRNVSVLGNGNIIRKSGKKVFYIREMGFGKTNTVSYPLFQCAKSSTANYEMRKIPLGLAKLILHLRTVVKELYGSSVKNVDRMFNIIICNNYTEASHQISGHRDDERWLEKNELDSNGKPCASIIASLTLYPEGEPDQLRNFEIQDDISGKWESKSLKNNSMIFFSNHMHRAKSYPKTLKHKQRINLTFRTILPGLIGRVGYGNFYRYMSIPSSICVIEKHRDKLEIFKKAAEAANIFNKKNLYNLDISLSIKSPEDVKRFREQYKNKLDLLPRYVKPLCSVETLIVFA